jgi:epoxyqueuosine reductase
MPMSTVELTLQLKAEAYRIGLDRVGIAPAVSPPGYGRLLEWLRADHAAGMTYMKGQVETRQHPDRLFEGVRSVVMASVVYGQPTPAPRGPHEGKIARYAYGQDYHRVLWDRLDALLDWLRQACPEVRGRAVVDTAPLLERDFAQLAGLGWIGKNTMVIDRKLGSFTFLGALLVDIELEPDAPHAANHCGTCTRCLEACPTGAFAGPYQLDARRCISYWTIEHRGTIPDDVAGELNGWVFGCDICQDVCPWNRKAPSGRMPEFGAGREEPPPNLIQWLDRNADAWRTALKGKALRRAKRAGLVRNAALVLGERRVAQAVGPLTRLLADPNEDPVIRASAAWALGRIGTESARKALEQIHESADPSVSDALEQALSRWQRGSDSGQAG